MRAEYGVARLTCVLEPCVYEAAVAADALLAPHKALIHARIVPPGATARCDTNTWSVVTWLAHLTRPAAARVRVALLHDLQDVVRELDAQRDRDHMLTQALRQRCGLALWNSSGWLYTLDIVNPVSQCEL